MTETREQLLGQIETLLGKFLTADSETDSQVMVTGYVFKVVGRTFESDGEVRRIHGWAAPEEQDVNLTLGLANGLGRDVESWYDSFVLYDDEDED